VALPHEELRAFLVFRAAHRIFPVPRNAGSCG
jgi:hypothetical protein